MTKRRLIIFTRNPELGKVKSRLAKTIGDTAALEIFKFLINHTQKITSEVAADRIVYYSDFISEDDQWTRDRYEKSLQVGADLGERMRNAFEDSFKAGYSEVIIIGTDMYDLNTDDINSAFEALTAHPYVIGPATDGGYYLLGMTSSEKDLFSDIDWGTETVYDKTLKKIGNVPTKILPERNDIDYFEDIKDEAVFHPFINHVKVG